MGLFLSPSPCLSLLSLSPSLSVSVSEDWRTPPPAPPPSAPSFLPPLALASSLPISAFQASTTGRPTGSPFHLCSPLSREQRLAAEGGWAFRKASHWPSIDTRGPYGFLLLASTVKVRGARGKTCTSSARISSRTPWSASSWGCILCCWEALSKQHARSADFKGANVEGGLTGS